MNPTAPDVLTPPADVLSRNPGRVAPRVLNNEDECRDVLSQPGAWRALFELEAGVATLDDAAQRLSVDRASADWVRRVAIEASRGRRRA